MPCAILGVLSTVKGMHSLEVREGGPGVGRCGALGQLFSKRETSMSPRWSPTVGGEGELVHVKTWAWTLRNNLGFGEEIRQGFSNFFKYTLLYFFLLSCIPRISAAHSHHTVAHESFFLFAGSLRPLIPLSQWLPPCSLSL